MDEKTRNGKGRGKGLLGGIIFTGSSRSRREVVGGEDLCFYRR